MIRLKSNKELELMRQAGRITAAARAAAASKQLTNEMRRFIGSSSKIDIEKEKGLGGLQYF